MTLIGKAAVQANLQPYLDLVGAFVEHRISAGDFETRFLSMFKAQTGDFADQKEEDERIFRILDRLFADVDAYVVDPELRESEEDLDEEQLRSCASSALVKLTNKDQ